MTQKYTALYERLSREDEKEGESNSIASQKELLLNYAREHGFPMPVHFTDDGFSGTRLDRPGFNEMLKAIEKGRIGAVIVKDLSRLGRNFLRVGEFMEDLYRKGIRLITVNESTDTINGIDESAPFRNMFNEYYARDTSRKIKASLHAKGMTGKPTLNNAPYGYLKSADDKDKWIVDEEAAGIVRRIFQMAIEGYGPGQIARILKEEQIEMPSVHMAGFGQGLRVNTKIEDPYKWHASTVRAILERREYLGCTVNFKTSKYFKDRKCYYNPEDEWMVFENTHPAIIDEETFNAARERLGKMLKFPDIPKGQHPLLPYLRCADCGSKMYARHEGKDGSIVKFICSGYIKKPHGTHCRSLHVIKEEAVMKEIKGLLTEIKQIADKNSSKDSEEELRQILKEHKFSALDEATAKLAVIAKRRAEIRGLLAGAYTDYNAGDITSEVYEALCEKYESEMVVLASETEKWKSVQLDEEKKASDIHGFLERLARYDSFDEITEEMLADLIDCIVIHEREDRNKRNSPQRIDVYLKTDDDEMYPEIEEAACLL